MLVAFGGELKSVCCCGGRIVLEVALTRHGISSPLLGSLGDREDEVGVLLSRDARYLGIEAGCSVKSNVWVGHTRPSSQCRLGGPSRDSSSTYETDGRVGSPPGLESLGPISDGGIAHD